MTDKRPKGILGIAWACIESSAQGRVEHRPPSADYPDSVVRRIAFTAGGGLGWTLSALTTPRPEPAPWKIVVVTGAPSWAEYWAPVLAALPAHREMVVVDRPGFAASEPLTCVPDLQMQAEALSPLLQAAPGQKVLLVGQSYGAAIATLMAAKRPPRLGGLVLLSSYLGELGPTARWLVGAGTRAFGIVPRDIRNAIIEITQQRGQLELVKSNLPKVRGPVHVLHGEQDDFAPIEVAKRLVEQSRVRHRLHFRPVAGANHFLTDGPTSTLLSHLEQCIPSPGASWKWPSLVAPRDATVAQIA
jgi:pimeloyl-ACP methyl ester carboxylesterase